jgi:hypothetical protein
LRRRVGSVKASDSLKSRVALSMAAERRWEKVHEDELAVARQPLRFRTALILAAAAAAAIPVSLRALPHGAGTLAKAPEPEVTKSTLGLDTMIDDFVDWHARPLPPEVTNASDFPAFEPYVGVPVNAPRLSPFGARLLGGRILPVHELRAAAMLQYTLPSGHRISVYVYDPHRITVTPSRLRARVFGDEPVYVGQVRGYSVAAAQHRGVGYAIASDLGDDESAEMALAAAPMP